MNTYTMLTFLDHTEDFDPARVTIVQGIRYEVDDTPMGIQFESTEDEKWFIAEKKFREYKRQCLEEIDNVEFDRELKMIALQNKRMDRYANWSMVILLGILIIGISLILIKAVMQ